MFSCQLPQAEATPSSEPQGKAAKEKELEALEGDGQHCELPVCGEASDMHRVSIPQPCVNHFLFHEATDIWFPFLRYSTWFLAYPYLPVGAVGYEYRSTIFYRCTGVSYNISVHVIMFCTM